MTDEQNPVEQIKALVERWRAAAAVGEKMGMSFRIQAKILRGCADELERIIPALGRRIQDT